MGSQLVEESVFPFLESASELNANSGKFTFFVLDDFKLKWLKIPSIYLALKIATVMVKMISKLPAPVQDELKEPVSK